MKIILNYYRPSFLLIIIMFCTAFVFQSCSKKDNGSETIPDDSEETVTVQVKVNGIKDMSDVVPAGNKASSSKNQGENMPKSEYVDFGGFAAMVSVETSPITETNVTENKRLSASDRKKYAEAADEKGFTYRIMLIDQKDRGKIYANVQGHSRMPLAIKMKKGAYYDVLAYSYNDQRDIPEITDPINQILTTPKDGDLIIADYLVAAIEPINEMYIQFQHIQSKVTVQVDARAIPATIENISATFGSPNYFQTGAFNLRRTSEFETIPYTTGNIPFKSSEIAGIGNRLQQAVFYTFQDAPDYRIDPFEVKIASMGIRPDGGALEIYTNKSISFPNIEPRTGHNTTVKINLLPKGNVVAGIEWANGNLYYDVNDPVDKYKIRPDDTQRRYGDQFLNTDYWSWGAETPTSAYHTDVNQVTKFVDPCTRVFPANSWRMPDITEFQRMGNIAVNHSSPDFKQVNGTFSYKATNGKWIQFNNDGLTSPDTEPSIVAPATGYYWSSTPGISLAYTWEPGAKFLNALRSSKNPSMKLNIRCVKNK